MSEIKRRANEARELKEHHIFRAICAEIQEAAVDLFMNVNSDINTITQAHEKVRAISTFLDAIQARIDAETFEDKQKAQHRE
jgi:hypothetical protein